jgi:hypothetical protein
MPDTRLWHCSLVDDMQSDPFTKFFILGSSEDGNMEKEKEGNYERKRKEGKISEKWKIKRVN